MPAMSRVFAVPTSCGQEYTLTLHEPSLTSDNLGMKTWVSSYLLSQRLNSLLEPTPQLVPSTADTPTPTPDSDRTLRALELGAGTGLVGLSFAALRGKSANIHLTDLPEIVPNLSHNAALNVELLNKTAATVTTGVLDWSASPETPPTAEQQYDLILAADPLYSPEHPRLLVDTIAVWLSRGLDARVVLEMPLRDAYLPQVQDLRQRGMTTGRLQTEAQSLCDAGGLFGVGAKGSNRFGSVIFQNMVLGSSSHHIRRHEVKINERR
jgi:hypothetical protein